MPASSPAAHTPELFGKRVVVGVCAGIAAFKAVHVVRALSELGADVHVVPTEASREFVGFATWEALSHNPVSTSVFDRVSDVQHVRIGQEADVILVVPATADFIARARMGRADDLLSATLLMARCPVIMAPAMHTEMWEHPATQENISVLAHRGVVVLDPASGRLTGADTGKGRLPEPEAIVDATRAVLASPHHVRDLEGQHIVVTAGGTQENIDPVRVLTNRSTGKQGYALAHAALARGAKVTLISANSQLEPPPGAHVVRVQSAADMAAAVDAEKGGATCIIMAAAVSDFSVRAHASKIKKRDSAEGLSLDLAKTTDILASLSEGRRRNEDFSSVIVGFAAETGDHEHTALEYAQIKARKKGADLLVFNDVSVNDFGSARNAVTFLDAKGDILGEAEGSKFLVSHAILDHISKLSTAKHPQGES